MQAARQSPRFQVDRARRRKTSLYARFKMLLVQICFAEALARSLTIVHTDNSSKMIVKDNIGIPFGFGRRYRARWEALGLIGD